jgi:hypothetical protein
MTSTFHDTLAEALSASTNLIDFFGPDLTAFLGRELNRPAELEHGFALLGRS